MQCNDCLVRLAVCYALLLAWFHTVHFTFPPLPPIHVKVFLQVALVSCTMLGHLPTVYPGCLRQLWLLASSFRAAFIALLVLFVSACCAYCQLGRWSLSVFSYQSVSIFVGSVYHVVPCLYRFRYMTGVFLRQLVSIVTC